MEKLKDFHREGGAFPKSSRTNRTRIGKPWQARTGLDSSHYGDTEALLPHTGNAKAGSRSAWILGLKKGDLGKLTHSLRAWCLMAKSGFWGKKGGFGRAHPLAEGIVLDGQLIALGPALCQQVLNAGQLLLQDPVLLLQGQQRGHGSCRMGWRKVGWDLGSRMGSRIGSSPGHSQGTISHHELLYSPWEGAEPSLGAAFG